jgi:predicted transposase YbfD/YdcC
MDDSTNSDTPVTVEAGSLYDRLQGLEDQRQRRGIRYPLRVVLVMIVLAKLAGEDTTHGMAAWLKHRCEWVCRYLGFERGTTPHATTLGRVLGQAVVVETLDGLVGEYLATMQAASAAGKGDDGQPLAPLAMDGKTLRGTIPRGQTQGVHLLAIYSPTQEVVHSQVMVDRKENEIVAAPQLLKGVALAGKVVTADALHAQVNLAAQIVTNGGDYLFVVKENQPRTYAALQQLFTEPPMRPGFSPVPKDFRQAVMTNKAHGRRERRCLTASSLLNDYLAWPGLAQVMCIEREAVDMVTGVVTRQKRYAITSLSPQRASARTLLRLQRQHWQIENALHYRRDVTFGEDASHVRNLRAQRVMASLNNLTLGIIRRFRHYPSVPDDRRLYSAHPELALRHLLTAPS